MTEKTSVNQKKDSRHEAKDIRKGRADLQDGNIVMDGFVFEERIEGAGDMCDEEKMFHQLHGHTQDIKQKAWDANVLIREGCERSNNLQEDLELANDRSQKLNANMHKYVKK